LVRNSGHLKLIRRSPAGPTVQFFHICNRKDIVQVCKSPLPIIEHLDILADLSDSFLPFLKLISGDEATRS
jgi:hypothetical protein